MTEQSQNTVFQNSSFLQGQNAHYVEALHARYAEDPNSVDAQLVDLCAGLSEEETEEPETTPTETTDSTDSSRPQVSSLR